MINANVAKAAGLNDAEAAWINSRLADVAKCEQDARDFSRMAERARDYCCIGADTMDGYEYDEAKLQTIRDQFSELKKAAEASAKAIHEQIAASPYYKKYIAECGDVFGGAFGE